MTVCAARAAPSPARAPVARRSVAVGRIHARGFSLSADADGSRLSSAQLSFRIAGTFGMICADPGGITVDGRFFSNADIRRMTGDDSRPLTAEIIAREGSPSASLRTEPFVVWEASPGARLTALELRNCQDIEIANNALAGGAALNIYHRGDDDVSAGRCTLDGLVVSLSGRGSFRGSDVVVDQAVLSTRGVGSIAGVHIRKRGALNTSGFGEIDATSASSADMRIRGPVANRADIAHLQGAPVVDAGPVRERRRSPAADDEPDLDRAKKIKLSRT